MPGSMCLFRATFVSIVSLVGCAGSALAQCVPYWKQLQVTGPSARAGHSMAYDAAREQIVLFGGAVGFNPALADTWLWDGSAWSQASPATSPPGRTRSGMAYDSQRQVVVVFGGLNFGLNPSVLGDTWEWDGVTWTQRVVSGPPARSDTAMAYDAARGVTVLYGGISECCLLGDTWEWDGNTWTQVNVAGPSPRGSHAMTYDAARAETVLFGGGAFGPVFNETWTFDGSAWTLASSTGPSARLLPALTYHAEEEAVILFGGRNAQDPDWRWDGTTWTELTVLAPSPREATALAYDADAEEVLLFGGSGFFGSPVNAQTWRLRFNQLPGDINQDGVVDDSDLGLLLAQWNTSIGQPGYLDAADIDGNGTVNDVDLGLLLSNFGSVCN